MWSILYNMHPIKLSHRFKSFFFNPKRSGFLCIFLCLWNTNLMGSWSSPPEVIYSSSPPYNANNPSIATDENGNSIAVWIDTSDTGSLQAATLASGAVKRNGSPDWRMTNPITSSNVQDDLSAYTQSIGMDANGKGMAAWTDGTYIYVSTLTFGETNWSTPLIINTPVDSQVTSGTLIAVAANGNTIVIWLSSPHPYDYTVFANVYDAGSQTWRGQTNIIGGGVEFYSDYNHIAVDPLGNAVISLFQVSNNLQAVAYHFNSNVWVNINSVAVNEVTTEYCAMDHEGNAIIVWMEFDGTVQAATLPYNQTSLTNQTTLSIQGDPITSLPVVVVNEAGNGVTVWPDASGALASACYSFDNKTWTVLPLLDLQGNIPQLISLSGDAVGNAVASWTIFSDPNSYIQTAALGAGDSSWKYLTQLSPSLDEDGISQIILTSQGNAVALWENLLNESGGTINSAIFINIFYPLSPENFSGKVLKNEFLTGTDRIHKLQWGASFSPSITEYRLYRGSQLIVTLPAGKNYYTYEDHDRNKSFSDTYKLISINANGEESDPVFVTLQ